MFSFLSTRRFVLPNNFSLYKKNLNKFKDSVVECRGVVGQKLRR